MDKGDQTVLAEAADTLRSAMSALPAGAAWEAGKVPDPHEVFTPRGHRNVLDLNRFLVVGNRGVGKTFWSHTLLSREARELVASAYDLPNLVDLDAVFAYRGTLADDIAPSSKVLTDALARTPSTLIVWQAVLLRCYGPEATQGLPGGLTELAAWLAQNPEEGERRIRTADGQRQRPLVVLFDALDTLADEWAEIRERTEGLLRLAVLAKGLKSTRIKIFMRPDQFADTQLFRFPDASKLRAERVELRWPARDLYALLFFHFWRNNDARIALLALSALATDLFVTSGSTLKSGWVYDESRQRRVFEDIAGEWMGRDKKRGATYSWLVQHLADARGETTPRGFLTALRAAADAGSHVPTQVIDYRGIQHGVAEASENRVDDLLQDYWWIDYLRGSLSGLEVPVDREFLLQTWVQSRTVEGIRAGAKTRGLLPVFLTLREVIEDLPKEVAELLSSDEAAVLESLKLIGVAEIRASGKVNVPDIFRVAFRMKRRGGVPPRRAFAG